MGPPSAENDNELVPKGFPSMRRSASPVSASHTITACSEPPVASFAPHGENTTALSPAVCATTGHPSCCNRWPRLSTSQRHAPVPSACSCSVAPSMCTAPLAVSQRVQCLVWRSTLATNLPVPGEIATIDPRRPSTADSHWSSPDAACTTISRLS